MIDNWLLGPVGRCINYISDEVVYSGLLHRALYSMNGNRTLLKLARMSLQSAGVDALAIDRIDQDWKHWEEMANQHVGNNFTAVHRHSLVGLWCIVETTVEDSVVMILEKSDQAEIFLTRAGFKIKKSPIFGRSESELRTVYRTLERQALSSGSIIDAYSSMLKALGIEVPLDSRHLTTLTEINAIRNCILHRGGVIDDRTVSSAPWLQTELGNEVLIDQERYLKYYDAIGAFAQALLKGVIESDYMQFEAPSS